MPRSQADRSFGFRAPGLIRILIAADPEEVLTAMEALGIQLIDKPGLFSIVQTLLGIVLGPVGDLIELIGAAEETILFARDALLLPLGLIRNDARDRLDKLLPEIQQQRLRILEQERIFRDRVEEAQEEAAQGKVTAVI